MPPTFEDTELDSMFQDHWEASVNAYNRAIDAGIPKEDARFFLTVAAPVNLTFSAYLLG